LSIIDKYIANAKTTGGVVTFSPSIALEIVNDCKMKQINILGIDGFSITEKGIQPLQEHSMDYTASWSRKLLETSDVWELVIGFITERLNLDIFFEIICNEND